jgi:catechol 2,3-dioxygenase-like lactoylglutathione lyase family enzyme
MVKFDHMRLPVSNPKVTRDWYVKHFGFEIEFENEWVIALKDAAGFTIFLYPPQGSLAGAKCCLVLQVDDVEEASRAGSCRHPVPPTAGQIFLGLRRRTLRPRRLLAEPVGRSLDARERRRMRLSPGL